MSYLQALALGIVQGLTEFLPVSSSGHLVLLQNLFGLHEPELLFDVCLHMGTLAAVCVVFRRDIASIVGALLKLPGRLKSPGGFASRFAEDGDVRMAVLIVVGSVPTAVLGLLFHRVVDRLFGAVWIVGAMLLVTGTFLWLTRGRRGPGRPIGRMGLVDALIIGVVQGLAIVPGISRSGSTISAALFLGLDRDLAGRFSFLLSIPAILGALVLNIDPSSTQTALSTGVILSGTIAAGMVGYAALRILLRMVRSGHLYRFAPYCWLAGAAALVFI